MECLKSLKVTKISKFEENFPSFPKIFSISSLLSSHYWCNILLDVLLNIAFLVWHYSGTPGIFVNWELRRNITDQTQIGSQILKKK